MFVTPRCFIPTVVAPFFVTLFFYSLMSSRVSRTGRVLAMVILLPGLSWAQAISSKLPPPTAPVNGPEVIKQGAALHDKGEFAAAIELYKTITPGDSTYGQALMELALSYEVNKQPEAAIAAAEKAMALGHFSPQLFDTQASAEEQLKHFDRAQTIYAEGLRRFPYAATIWYNQGVMQFQQKQMAPALASFQRAIELRPMHAGSHLLLAYLETQQNHPAHAMLGLLTFLALEPGSERSNNALVVLEKLATNSNDVWANERVPAVSNNDPFQELDLLISSRVALRKDYKTKVKFDANLVRQTQLLVEKFPTGLEPTEFWGRAYGPLMTALRTDVDYLTAFTYLTLSSARDQRAVKWVESNKSKTMRMAAAVRPALLQIRERQVVVGLTPETRAKAWFGNDDLLDALGDGENMDGANGQASGEWRLISDDGALQAIGTYGSDHVKTGRWMSYFPNGRLEKEATYVKGKREGDFKEYFDNGALSVSAVYADDEPNGKATLYDHCGTPREHRTYVKGKISGEATELYSIGKTKRTSRYKDGKKDGAEAGFYADGTPEYTYAYVDGQRQGPFLVYYADKTLERKGTYDKDALHGPYESFHANGKPELVGSFDHGKRIGVWKQYYAWGPISSEKTYGPDGELTGTFKDYDTDGRLFSQIEYQQGKVLKTAYFNAITGKLIAELTVKKSGKTPAKAWYFDGSPLTSGMYRDGNMEGEWKSVTGAGQPLAVRHYVAGQEEGVTEEFYPTGQLQVRQSFVHGDADGPYERFHPNGQIAQRGYYRAGQQHGIWQTYYVNGQLSTEEEFVMGEPNGLNRIYTPTGKPIRERRVWKNWIEEITTYDSTGAVRDHHLLTTPPAATEYTLTYPDGKVRQRIAVQCGDATGLTTDLLPSGKVERTAEMFLDRRNGAYEEFDPNTGKTTLKGRYRNDVLEGEWLSYYPDGTVELRCHYREGRLEGLRQSYAPNGKLVLEEQEVHGVRDGATRFYNSEGELLIEKVYRRGSLSGFRSPGADNKATGEMTPVPLTGMVIKVNFPNGKPALEEIWRNENIDGDRIYYFSSGQVYRRCHFVNDELQGKLQTYYPSGKPMEEENYSCGERDGVCRYFRPDGTLEQTKTYRAGELAGPTVYYDAQGKATRTDVYWGGYIYGSK
jgi:uncharacterized protein